MSKWTRFPTWYEWEKAALRLSRWNDINRFEKLAWKTFAGGLAQKLSAERKVHIEMTGQRDREYMRFSNAEKDEARMAAQLATERAAHAEAIAELCGALDKYHALVERASVVLMNNLTPDGPADSDTIELLLMIFDGPEQREAFETRAALDKYKKED